MDTDISCKRLYAINDVNIGSFVLNIRKSLPESLIANITRMKYNETEKLANIITFDYLDFFNTYNTGHIDFITVAQRSVRNSDKVHPMDLVCENVSEIIAKPFIKVFEPWNKTNRGKFAYKVQDEIIELNLTEKVNELQGKICYVFDDIVTTHTTLKRACAALSDHHIHCHGLAWLLWT
jgi:predicted amidophosphoribosyltransferase